MNINSITFIDVETCPEEQDILSLGSEKFDLYNKRFKAQIDQAFTANRSGDYDGDSMMEGNELQKHYRNNAALYAEFGKIVSISMGRMHNDKFKVKTITGRDERVLLEQFTAALTKSETRIFAGHNSNEFDLPFIFRRLIVNQLPVPDCLDVAEKKPWEVPHKDTMAMWSHLQFKYKCSLNVLAHILGIPSPKSEMSGDKVGAVYYGEIEIASYELEFSKEEAALRMIGKYNAGDVVTTALVYLRMKGLPLIAQDQIEYL